MLVLDAETVLFIKKIKKKITLISEVVCECSKNLPLYLKTFEILKRYYLYVQKLAIQISYFAN